MTDRPPFHLAIPVADIEEARRFYGEVLGFPRGRSSEVWTDWDVHGHQVVTHQGSPPALRGLSAHPASSAGSPSTPNSDGPNVVISAIVSPSTRSTSSLNPRNTVSPGRRR
jgi:catechol 2,3-dioxygenase-like lactoylglutathione lyase family enzyme